MSGNTRAIDDLADGYPRPDARRTGEWGLLDGRWDFAADPTTTPPTDWPSAIQVPYGWGTEASGVTTSWLEIGWYRLFWTPPHVPDGHRLVLHFGAVMHECWVWAGDQLVADHRGGQTSFEVDLTQFSYQPMELSVRVRNPLDKAAIPHGKQRSIPADSYDSCAFSPSGGIWQSVWWELRPERHLDAVELRPRESLDGWDVRVLVIGEPGSRRESVTLALDGVNEPGQLELSADATAELILDEPRLWSPEDPHLYRISCVLRDDDRIIDQIIVTAGIRRVEVRGRHLYLNGRRIFLRGVLDQGYWPRHGWTAPDVNALTEDLDHARELGFNFVRKHLKLEDPRWLHYADQIGMLVWEEPASIGHYSADAVAAFSEQLPAMVARDQNHPSIIVWGLYNEEWGLDWDVADDPHKQRALRDAFRLIKSLDATRLAVDCSGWSHVETDLVDWHIYAESQAGWKEQLKQVTDEEKPGLDVNLGNGIERKPLMANYQGSGELPMINSEYGTGHSSIDRAWAMRRQTDELRRDPGNNGYVYTELYDIEHETAGVLDFHRDPKDDLGLRSADVHAETVIIADLEPISPGCDLTTTDGEVSIDVVISHHGEQDINGRIAFGWATIEGSPADVQYGPEVRVDPFVASIPVEIRSQVPAGQKTARLHVWLIDGQGHQRAHNAYDVCSSRAE